MFNNFGVYLKQIMQDNKITNKVLAEWITDNYKKISKETIAKYRDGSRTPSPELISIIAGYFKINEQFFFSGEDTIKVKMIPLIGLASCGVPENNYYEDVHYIPVSEDIARDGVYSVTADGDSMLPKIHNRDIIICDTQMQCDNGHIVHYTTEDDESGIKKYSLNHETQQVTLYPLNTEGYEPIMIHKSKLRCARCFKIQSDL